MKTQNLLTLLAATMAVIFTASAAMAVDATLYFNASDPASGVDGNNWNSLTADSSQDWDFGDDVTLEDVTSIVPTITKAYRFTGVKGDDNNPSWSAYNEVDDASWELWIKPDDSGTLDAAQVILESGGAGTGFAIWYEPGTTDDGLGTIHFTIDGGNPPQQDTVSAVISTEDFHQVILVFDDASAAGIDLLQIYVDGVLIDDNDPATTFDDTTDTDNGATNNWSGGDNSGLGKQYNSLAETANEGQFDGDIAVLRFWESTALTGLEITQIYLQNFVSPANGGVAEPGDVTLEWANLDPNTTVDPENKTYVDVWFGTDSDKASGNYTKVVSGAEGITSVVVTPPGAGIYYWQVDSYLDGDPAVVDYTQPNDPNMVEGLVNSFTNDVAPSVDASDMITLYELPTQLNPSIVDDGSSELTYLWEVASVLPGGLEVSFDATDIADPVVTFAKVPYASANIVNPSFEDGNTGWTFTGTGSSMTYGNGKYNGFKPDGNYAVYISQGNFLYQDLNEIVQEGATYTLSVEAGFDTYWGSSTTYIVQLLAGSGEDAVVLAEDSAFIDDPNNYYHVEVTYVNDPVADADKIGQPLQIRLGCEAGSNINAFYDMVELTSDPNFPGVAGTSSVDLKVTVQDATNPAVSGTMTVEVYNDGCSAAREGLGLSSPVDFDEDCIVNLEDLGILSANWLNDKALTGPVVDAQATYISVPNGDFELLYKPDTRITGVVESQGWTKGTGSDCPIDSKKFQFDDGTTGSVADIPGWVGYDGEGWAASGGTNGRDLTDANQQGAITRQANHTVDGLQCYISNGGNWASPGGGLIVSEVTLGTAHSGKYTLSLFIRTQSGGALPVEFDLVADGVVVSESSSVLPTLNNTWQEFTKVYEPNELDPYSIEKHIGKPLKIVLGVGRNSTGAQTRFDDVALSVEVTDSDLPSVDLGSDMISAAGVTVQLNPAVTNNDSQSPQRALSYAWTAYPSDGVTFSDSASPNPTVTFINTGKVVLDLAVTLEGAGVVSDSVIYEVYEDACKAAIIIDPSLGYDLTDLNSDCITNLVDFADLAADWMVDYTLTEGQVK